jgi:hypothetical protein
MCTFVCCLALAHPLICRELAALDMCREGFGHIMGGGRLPLGEIEALNSTVNLKNHLPPAMRSNTYQVLVYHVGGDRVQGGSCSCSENGS